MSQNYKATSIILAALIFLIPIFFIPGGALSLLSAKAALFSIGLGAAFLSFLFESYRAGKLSFPRGYFLAAAVALPAVYLLSSLLATPSSLSLMGHSLETGTFGFILLGSAALLISSAVFSEAAAALQAAAALFASLLVAVIFVWIRIMWGGGHLGLGAFSYITDSPVGNWTDLSMMAGALALLSAVAVGMIPMKKQMQWILYAAFALSAGLLAILGFSTALWLTLAGGALLAAYFAAIESNFHFAGNKADARKRSLPKSAVLPLILVVASLIFLINPRISSSKGTLKQAVSSALHLQSTDVRPTLSATLDVSKAVLAQSSLLGSGPNTFQQDWLIFKPASINATPFWGVGFPFGVGFLATQIATTGILGTAVWIIFLILLVALAIRALAQVPDSRSLRLSLLLSMLISLFVWAGSAAYSPSGPVIMIGFIFAGVAAGIAHRAGLFKEWSLSTRAPAQTRVLSIALVLALAIGAAAMMYSGGKRAAAAYYYERAVALASSSSAQDKLPEIESDLARAAKISPADIYYEAIARLNFTKAQLSASSASGSPASNQAAFQDALSKSVTAAKSAISSNPSDFQNWAYLGQVYSSLVPAPFKVEGAYENAQMAFNEALKRNPNDPEIYLMFANLEIAKGNADQARTYIRNAISLKQDYADAYILLTQLEASQNNIPAALSSTEALAQLTPNDPGVHFELGAIKYSSGDYAGAEAAFRDALKLEPAFANAKYYLALALIKEGQDDDAKQLLEDLQSSNPDSQEVQAALKSLQPSSSKKR